MAVRLSHVCDNTPVHGEDEVEGSVQEVAIGRLTGLLDLCDGCRSLLVEPLRLLLVEHGRTENGKAIRAGAGGRRPRGLPRTNVGALPEGMTVDEAQALADEGKCPLDPTCAPLHDRTAVGAHIRNYHGIAGGFDTLGMGKRGRNTVGTHGSKPVAASEFTCTDCNPPREFESAQGFGAHKARIHKVKRRGAARKSA